MRNRLWAVKTWLLKTNDLWARVRSYFVDKGASSTVLRPHVDARALERELLCSFGYHWSSEELACTQVSCMWNGWFHCSSTLENRCSSTKPTRVPDHCDLQWTLKLVRVWVAILHLNSRVSLHKKVPPIGAQLAGSLPCATLEFIHYRQFGKSGWQVAPVVGNLRNDEETCLNDVEIFFSKSEHTSSMLVGKWVACGGVCYRYRPPTMFHL